MRIHSRLWNRIHGGLQSRSFVRLTQTCALSSAGDALIAVALAGSVFFNEDPNTARSRVALSLVLTMAPFAVVAPFLGPWIDRARGGRRLVLACSGALRAFLCLLMASSLNAVWLYPMVFLALICSKTHAVAKSAAVPEIVTPASALVRANSVLSISAVIAGFVAAIVGGVVSFIAGNEWVVRIGALVFAVEAALAFEVATASSRAQPAEESTTVDELRRAGVLPPAAVIALLRMIVGFVTFLIAFDLRRSNAPVWWFGVAIGAAMLGSSLGSFCAPQLRGRIREEWMIAGSTVVVAVVSLALVALPGRSSSACLAAVVGFGAGAAKLAFDSIVQRDASATVHGRSFARFEALFQLVWVVGALMPVVVTIPAHTGFLLIGVACVAMVLWFTQVGLLKRPAT